MTFWRPSLFILLVSFSVHAKTKIVILGDSLTDGYGVARENAYPALVEKALKAAGKEVEVVNGGSSGSTAASGPSRIKWFLKGKPQIVMVALGANDALRGFSMKSTEKELSTTIEFAKQSGLKVLLAGMKAPPNYGKEYGAELEKIYRNLAAKHKVPLLPFLLEGVGGISTLNLPDGIHPNEAGHAIIAKLVEKHLKPLL